MIYITGYIAIGLLFVLAIMLDDRHPPMKPIDITLMVTLWIVIIGITIINQFKSK